MAVYGNERDLGVFIDNGYATQILNGSCEEADASNGYYDGRLMSLTTFVGSIFSA